MIIRVLVGVVLMVVSILLLNLVGALLGVAMVKWAQEKNKRNY